jgi:methionyl-tRNA formyltransferase
LISDHGANLGRAQPGRFSGPASSALSESPSGRLRTVFCTRGGLFGALVLHRLRSCERIEICGIVRSTRQFHPSYGFLRGALEYIRRSGLLYSLYLFCATTFADLVCALSPIGCVPLGRRSRRIPLFATSNINDPAGLQFLRECQPDLLISAFFDQRFQEPALGIPALACLNVHPSLLPSFKGVDPVLQANVQRARPLGVTVHYMTPALDAGNILVQQAVRTPDQASVFEGTALLYREGAELLASSFDRVQRGDTGCPQGAEGSYQSWPTRAELRELRKVGGALIRWSDFRVLWRRTDATATVSSRT